jgi:hypothetical protein
LNLVSSTFEKQLRRLHRAELEKSGELRREFRQARKKDNSAVSRIGRRLLLPLFWILIPASLVLKDNNVQLALAVISFWAAGSAFRWGQQWFQHFYGSEELVIFHLLPLNDEQIFQIQKRKYLRSLGWIFWELLIAYLVLGIFDASQRPPLYILPLAALAQSLLVLAMGLHLAGYLHMLPLGAVAGLLRMAAIILFLWGMKRTDYTDAIVNFSHWFFPTGWLNYTLTRLSIDRDWISAAMLIPIAALIFAMRFSWQRLRGFYSLEGFEILPSSAGISAADDEELTDASFGPRRGPTEIEDNISARFFLEGVNWQQAGWFERLVSRILTHREHVLTEFLVAEKPGWSRQMQITMLVWVIACLVVWSFGTYGGTIIFFSAYILATASLPLFGGEWRGLRQTPSGGVFLPGFSVFPIAFNEIVKILLKINLLRILAASPFLLSFSAAAAYRLGHSPFSGLKICIQILAILVTLQPVFVLLPISKSTNDTTRMKPLWFFVFLPMLLLVIILGISIFLTSPLAVKLALYALLLLISTLFFILYRWMYRRGKFDLLSERMGEQQ